MRRFFWLGVLAVPVLVHALTFQERIEDVTWEVEGDRFECRLSQPVPRFGYGMFVRRAGEKPVFRIVTREAWLARGNAMLYAAAATWRGGESDLLLGRMPVAGNERSAESDQKQAGRLLSGVLEGRAPVVRHKTVQGEPLEIRLHPVNVLEAYQSYLDCTAKLLPINFDQAKFTMVRFDDGYELNERAMAHLDILLDYMAEDKTVNRIRLDGHSDNSGDRLINRDLSRRRALVVKNYLTNKGIADEAIIVRFHGERYPAKPNTSSANKAANRRVTIQLERHDERFALTPEQEEEKLDLQ
ncbi:MAG: OmpA family protein [Thiopseudomonas sp.]|nr:OmpA family protein [Thiopseudomonas sp.]